jgi:hypothetical protein
VKLTRLLPFGMVLAACGSGPDPSTTGADTSGVLVTGLSG